MKKRVVSLLLCLIMALSLIPTVAFADDTDANANTPAAQQGEIAVQSKSGGHHGWWWGWGDWGHEPGHEWKPGHGNDDNNGNNQPHVDVRVAGTVTISKTVNGVPNGASQTINVTISNVTGTADNTTLDFKAKSGQGNENEWRAKNISDRPSTITISCTATGTVNGVKKTWNISKTYGSNDIQTANTTCPNQKGYDFNISEDEIEDIITHTVVFFTEDTNKGMLKVNATSDETKTVAYTGLSVGDTFPTVPSDSAKSGYTFDGWYVATNVTDTSYTKGEKVTAWPTTVTGDAYYVAVWTATEPTTVDISVEKRWDDNNNAANKRPTTVTVKLLANGTVVSGKTLDLYATNNWSGTFSNLDKYDANNQEISYTVEEASLPEGYTATVTGSAANGFTITNKYQEAEQKTGTLTITKTITGLTVKDLPKAISFTVKGPNNYSETVKFVATDFDTTTLVATKEIKNLPVGAYTVTEDKASAQVDGYTLTNVATDFEKVANVTENGGSASFTNTYVKHTTAKVTIVKHVNVTGNTQPSTMPTFTFVAKVGGKEVGKLSLTPTKGTDGKWTASGDMSISIPAKLFGNKDYVEVTISEVKGNLTNWTYDTHDEHLNISKDGRNHVIVYSAAEVVPTDPIASFTFTNTYTYTYTPPTRPTNPIRRQPTTTTKPVQSVKTGDMGIALYAVTSLLSLSGTALVIKKRKDEK